jgi:heme/copper-type cytochrome/quinol oxidase subunit 2
LWVQNPPPPGLRLESVRSDFIWWLVLDLRSQASSSHVLVAFERWDLFFLAFWLVVLVIAVVVVVVAVAVAAQCQSFIEMQEEASNFKTHRHCITTNLLSFHRV